MKDARGLDVTSNDAAAVAAADDFAARLLRLDQGVEAILDAAKRWPDTPIVQLYAAAFWLYGQTDGALENAAAHLRAADARAMNARERALHRALTLWHGNDNLRAVEALEAITTEWPSDLLTAKIAEFLYYVLGQQYMGPRFRAHMRRLEGAHAGDPDFLAMAAFASELCGDYVAAEAVAERALGIEPRNHGRSTPSPTSSSARAACGTVLRAWKPSSRCWRPADGRSIRHDAWHLALLHLEELDVAAAMRVFRAHIWGITPDFVVEQLDAIALLWRIEMAAGPMDAEWPAIAEHIAPRVVETFMPFMNAHYAYALARAGRADAVEAVLARVRARSAADDEEAKRYGRRWDAR